MQAAELVEFHANVALPEVVILNLNFQDMPCTISSKNVIGRVA